MNQKRFEYSHFEFLFRFFIVEKEEKIAQENKKIILNLKNIIT